MRKNKKIIETHGKEESSQITMLEQVWGYNEYARYGTKNETEYRRLLDDMNRTDLETHARKLGVVILESSARLKEKLVSEFNKYVLSLSKPVNKLPSNHNISEEVKKILAEGR